MEAEFRAKAYAIIPRNEEKLELTSQLWTQSEMQNVSSWYHLMSLMYGQTISWYQTRCYEPISWCNVAEF